MYSIRAIIGKVDAVEEITNSWYSLSLIKLPQDFAMIFPDDVFLEDLIELSEQHENHGNKPFPEELWRLTSVLFTYLQEVSHQKKLGYFEASYSGGEGEQSAILFEDGHLTLGPLTQTARFDATANGITKIGPAAINQILAKLGAWRQGTLDEFECLGLGNYRNLC